MPKNPKRKRDTVPSVAKQPRAVEVPDSQQTVKWCFRLFDRESAWHDPGYTEESFREVAHLMKSYSTRTWGEIEHDRHRDHEICMDSLCKEARQRLQQLKLDDFPLFRFRFDGLKRLYGIRMGRFFQVLWWDPQHKVCPSQKKHT